ncbi:MAG: F-type H+-transporting ATPase subunit gamma [Acidobacteriota bacterium]|jgi:F-type H+-transporting ATPase subunit gamma|nr:F-type H+-transporting ATPase subunit gamma [Acidobacteriota bacterium]
MANRRVLVKRRKSVRNIRKITRTMQLIATARFQAAFNRAVATKPYTEKLAELVADLSRAAGNVEHPLLQTHDDVKASALVVISSDRGLAGGYNSNVLRAAVGHIEEQRGRGVVPRVHMVGRKGINFFKFLRREIAEQTTGLGDKPRFEQIEPIANDLMDRFIRGEIASAHVAYMRFHSAGVQRPAVIQLLPLSTEQQQGKEEARPVEYEFSPDPKQLLDELLPATVRARLFQAFNDAIVSEQVARMVAMKAATDAAGDMIKALTREYNRARQTQITMELLDIVGGANALS